MSKSGTTGRLQKIADKPCFGLLERTYPVSGTHFFRSL